MLHIILMILKILGILILSILGLGLCIGLLVLFCPVRYYLEGSIYGKPKGHIRVSWLLRLICITFSYQENQFAYQIRIFGIRLRKRKKKELQIEQKAESKQEKKKIRFFKRQKEENSQILKETEEYQESEEKLQETKEKEKAGQKNENITNENIRDENIRNENIRAETQQVTIDRKEEEEPVLQLKADKKKDWLQFPRRIISVIKSIPLKIKEILSKIKGIFTKIKETFSAVKTGIQKLLTLLKDLNKKKQVVLTFIKDEKNKKAFHYTKGKLFQLLCHVLPGKVTVKLHYGFEDPATTGILTGMIFMFYPKSAEKFQLMPDFENRVFEGELMIKGRVRLAKVLWILISIYFHKECNRMIKMIIKR